MAPCLLGHCPVLSCVHLIILWLLVKTCTIPHLPKRAHIIFKGFCGHDFSLGLRKKRLETEEEGRKLGRGRTRKHWKGRQEKVKECIRSRGMKE